MGDEDAFQKRAAALGLARTLGLPVDATITARTLAADHVLPAKPVELPRISVDERDAAPSASPIRRDYTIVGTIGEGGMGRVQLARQRSLDRDVALKTLKADASPAVTEALLREARLTGALEHPGVIPVHALGVDETGRPMLVMKRIDGVDLSVMLHDPDHLAWRGRPANRLVAALEILIQVSRTVEFAHSRGVIHRDIKPENIMVGGFGEVYLLDWGIATRVEDAGAALVGTPAYIAPEMVLGEPISPRTDVYLLGATLHEILTGKLRHQGDTVVEVLRAAALSTPAAYGAEVPDELASLCTRATARDPAARPAGAADFREALADFLRHRSARALCDAAVERLAALEQLVTRAPVDLSQAYRLVTEARFGLVQSLREHPGDEGARAGMQRCLAAAIDLELRQGHADTADALFRELEHPDAAVAQRIAEVRAAVAARARERERLEALDRDLDPTVRSGERSLTLIATAVVVTIVASVVVVRQSVTPLAMLLAALSAFVLIAVGFVLTRHRVLTNSFNRRTAAALLIAVGATTVHRALNYLSPQPPPMVLAVDLLMLCACGAVVSFTMLTRMLWMCVPLLGGVGGALLWPEHSPAVFGGSTAISMVLAAGILARARRST